MFRILLISLALTAGAVGCQNRPRPDVTSIAADDQIRADQVMLTVEGLSCPLCATNVDRQLARLPGVSKVTINLGDGTLFIDVKPGESVSQSALRHAIEEAGYTLVRVDAR